MRGEVYDEWWVDIGSYKDSDSERGSILRNSANGMEIKIPASTMTSIRRGQTHVSTVMYARLGNHKTSLTSWAKRDKNNDCFLPMERTKKRQRK